MKKLTLMILSGLLLVSLCSCGNSKPVDMSKIETQDVYCGEFSFKIPKEWDSNIDDQHYYATQSDYFIADSKLFDGYFTESDFEKFYKSYSADLTKDSKLIKTDTVQINGRTFYIAKMTLNIDDSEKNLLMYVTYESRTVYSFCMVSSGKANYDGYLKGIINTIELNKSKAICKKSLNDFVEWYSIFFGELLTLPKLDSGYATHYTYYNSNVSLSFFENSSDKSITSIDVTAKNGHDDYIFSTVIMYVDDFLRLEDTEEILEERNNEFPVIEKNGLLYHFDNSTHSLWISRIK